MNSYGTIAGLPCKPVRRSGLARARSLAPECCAPVDLFARRGSGGGARRGVSRTIGARGGAGEAWSKPWTIAALTVSKTADRCGVQGGKAPVIETANERRSAPPSRRAAAGAPGPMARLRSAAPMASGHGSKRK
jgi:hypothetical protein